MTIHFGLVGAGGFGREVMPYARQSVAQQLGVREAEVQVCFIETWEPKKTVCNGRPLISLDAFLALPGDHYFNVAVGDGAARARIVEQIGSRAQPIAIISPHAIMLEENQIGEGVVLCPNSLVTSNTRIGKFFHANPYSSVTHDCVIGNYVTFAPGARCSGHVHIGDYAYVGAGSVIKQGTREKPLVIGALAVIGIGAVVTKDVPPGVTVVGNPSRPLAK
jgi:sugar O-acyltransferase (sialic acid O-acetyltransferase NeuD family)